MTLRRGLLALAVGTVSGAIFLPGAALAADPAFTLRYSGQGWADVVQVGAAALTCPPEATACRDGSDPQAVTSWLDVDKDPSTVNSSQAVLTVPPKASVDWVGLYWAGDRGSRTDGAPPRCEAAGETATPPTLPPRPDQANQIKLAVGAKPYAVVTANSLTNVSGPAGGSGFQAYLDITALVRPAAPVPTPTPISLTVAELQVAAGPGCGGGWTAVLAYSYQDGPDRTYAPDFRSIAVFDGTLSAPAGVRQQVRLDGVPQSNQEGPQPRLTSALFGSGQSLGPNALTFGSAPVARSAAAVTGITAYQQAVSPVAATAVTPGAVLGVTPSRAGFVAGVLGLSTPLPVKVNLAVTVTVSPKEVQVGQQTAMTVTVSNGGDVTATGVKVAVRLPAGTKLAAEAPGFDAGSGIWNAPPIAANASGSIALEVLVETAGELTATAQISASDIRYPPAKEATVTITAQPVAGPSASTPAQAGLPSDESWSLPQVAPAILFGVGLFLLGLLMLSVAVVRHRARAQ